MLTTVFRQRTLVAYAIDESSGDLVVNVLGLFHAGADWAAVLAEDQVDADGA